MTDAAEPTPKVQIKKRDLLTRVSERSGVGGPDSKSALDAALGLIGEALAAGQELVLPPLGRLKVARTKETPKGKVFMLRLAVGAGEPAPKARPAKVKGAGKGKKQALAADDEQG